MGEHVARADTRGLSRRDFARAIGIGAGAVAAGAPPALLGDPGTAAAQQAPGTSPLNFGRMFPDLPAFAEPTDSVKALRELGASGGIMDAKDNLAAGPVQLIVDPGAEREQAGQPEPHGRDDVRRPVHRPRRHVRRRHAARRAG